jgi:hypothetical protein
MLRERVRYIRRKKINGIKACTLLPHFNSSNPFHYFYRPIVTPTRAPVCGHWVHGAGVFDAPALLSLHNV